MVNMKDIAVHYDKISAFDMLVDIAKVAGVESIQAALDEIAAQQPRALDVCGTCGGVEMVREWGAWKPCPDCQTTHASNA